MIKIKKLTASLEHWMDKSIVYLIYDASLLISLLIKYIDIILYKKFKKLNIIF